MTDPSHAPPRLARVPLQADDQAHALLIVQEDGRVIEPAGGLCQVLGFVPDGAGGWVSAAQAGDGRWGYLDGQGAWRVPATLDDARNFSADGVARFCDQGRWGFLDLSGRVTIAPFFSAARPMRGGVAAVQTAPDTWRILRHGGDFASDCTFEDLGAFAACGLARARSHGAFGYVDRTGHWAIAPQLQRARDFAEQPVAVASIDGHTYGLLDAEGAWVLPPCYPRIDAFNDDGLAFFAEADEWQDGHGYLDTQGRVALRGGAYLSPQMACGRVADHSEEDGSVRYLAAPGPATADASAAIAALSPPWSYGTDFRRAGCMAVVRRASAALQVEASERGMGLVAPGPARGAWGLLHADGRFVPAPGDVLEPLTGADGWLAPLQPGTALVPFHTTDGQLAWIDGEGTSVWRAHYDGQQAALLDADGRPLWHSAPREACWPPRPFFHAPLVDHLQSLASADQIGVLAHTLAATAEQRLHALAAGQPPASATEEADRQATTVSRCVLRATLSEAHQAAYAFLVPERERLLREGRRVLAQRLGQRHGTPDQHPDHAAPADCGAGEDLLAWAVPPSQALPGDDAERPEGATALWLSLHARRSEASPTEEGEAWWELWLMAAPDRNALRAAQAGRAAALRPVQATAREAEAAPQAVRPAPQALPPSLSLPREETAPPRVPVFHVVLPPLAPTVNAAGASSTATATSARKPPEQAAQRSPAAPRPQASQPRKPQHQPPDLALMVHFVLSVVALACHVSVALTAWNEAGPLAGLGTLVLMGFAELYWAWRFVFHTPESLVLAAAALLVVLYLFAWFPLYRRMGQSFSAHGAAA